MHNLLQRQLKKYFGSNPQLSEAFEGFVAAINESYLSFDSDRQMLQRAMELSSQELAQANSELRAVFQAIPDLILRLDRDGNLVDLRAAAQSETLDPADFFRRQFGRKLADLPELDVRGKFQHALQELLLDQKPKAFEYLVNSDFGPFYFEARLVPHGGDHAIAIIQDITKRKHAITEHERLNQELLTASRQAGMAEVATGVLHNVGNVLNSINISASLLRDNVNKSQVQNLLKATTLLRDHAADSADFLAHDPKGQKLPGYLIKLGDHLAAEQQTSRRELEDLAKNIEHIKAIVTMQQGYARLGGLSEALEVKELIEDALRINQSSIGRSNITVMREFHHVPKIAADKHKVLQILINLIRNAQHSLGDSNKSEKILAMVIRATDEGQVMIQVSDNGIGIAPQNLSRIFQLGFTTKRDGHGFGLHSGANAAREMGGRLQARSAGPGMGATFTLELPAAGNQLLRATAAKPLKSLTPANHYDL